MLVLISRAYPKSSLILIIAATVTTPKNDVSLISYIRNTFLHDPIQFPYQIL